MLVLSMYIIHHGLPMEPETGMPKKFTLKPLFLACILLKFCLVKRMHLKVYLVRTQYVHTSGLFLMSTLDLLNKESCFKLPDPHTTAAYSSRI